MNRVASVSLGCLLCAMAVLGQGDRGIITGTVSDSSGALVPNTRISIVNTATGARYETVSTDTGNYTVPALPIGTYQLTAEHEGFSRYEQTNITVQVAVTARIDIPLQIGQTNQSIQVSAEASLLKTESAEQSTTVSGQKINSLPINFGIGAGAVRNPLSFVSLAPGASISGWNVIKVNGNPTTTYKVLLEGQESSSTLNPKVSDEMQPSVEAIQEFSLQTSNFAAEYGQVAGGLFNFTTKSGTNQFHGSAYDYLTNEALNAGIPFTDDGDGNHRRARVGRQDFGFSVGGPVWIPKVYNGRDRTFFFFNYEMYRDRAVNILGTGTVPTAGMRNGDFSSILTGRRLGTDPLGRAILENTIYDPASDFRDASGKIERNPFPGNIIPMNRINPAAAKVLSYIPAPVNGGLINNYPLVVSFSKIQYIPSVKIDHSFTDTAKISGYWSEQSTSKDNGQDGMPDPISQRRDQMINSYTIRLNYNQSLSPTLLLHLGAGVQRYRNPDTSPAAATDFDAGTILGISGLPSTGFPRFYGIGSSTFGGYYNPQIDAANIGIRTRNLLLSVKPTAVADVTWVRGNHTYKAGSEFKIDSFTSRNSSGIAGQFNFSTVQTGLPSLNGVNLGGGGVGFALASFLLGDYNSANLSTHAGSSIPPQQLSLLSTGHLEGQPPPDSRLRNSLRSAIAQSRNLEPHQQLQSCHS